jgi:hypothetical protein
MSGKTTLQFLLADFLKSQGHSVFVTDENTEDWRLPHYTDHHQRHPPAQLLPNPVYLHIAAKQVTDPREDVHGRTPLEWQRSLDEARC